MAGTMTKKIRDMHDKGCNPTTISRAVGMDVSRINGEISQYRKETRSEIESVDYFGSSYYHHIL